MCPQTLINQWLRVILVISIINITCPYNCNLVANLYESSFRNVCLSPQVEFYVNFCFQSNITPVDNNKKKNNLMVNTRKQCSNYHFLRSNKMNQKGNGKLQNVKIYYNIFIRRYSAETGSRKLKRLKTIAILKIKANRFGGNPPKQFRPKVGKQN